MVVYVGIISSTIRGRGDGVAFCRRDRGKSDDASEESFRDEPRLGIERGGRMGGDSRTLVGYGEGT